MRLFKDEDGEPRVWTHFINYTKRERKGDWARHGAFFLNWPGNELRVEWSLFRLKFGFTVTVSGDDDDALSFVFGFPGLGAFYINLKNCDWLLKLTGTKWYKGQPMEDWRREIGFSVFDGALVIYPWINGNHYPTRGRGVHFIRPDDIIFGRSRYRKYNERSFDVVLSMPEGDYPAKVTLFTSEWKRPRWPRWPLTHRCHRAEVDVEGGVPVPGKGENDYDMDDDAIFSLSADAQSVDEALEKIRLSALRDRERHGGKGWVPDAGWPAHMVSRE